MLALGAFVAYYSTRYDLGSFRRMGPGMFPMLLGYALCLVGGLIFIPALYKPASGKITFETRSFVFIIGALIAFALTVPRFGMVPAVIAMAAVAVLADGQLKPLQVLALCAALSAIAVVLFHHVLGTALVLFRWPF